MWIQIITLTCIIIGASVLLFKVFISVRTAMKEVYALLLYAIVLMLVAVLFVMSYQLNELSKGCPELQKIEQPVYYIKE